MSDKAHDELAATVTTDSADPISRALGRHAGTAARVLLRTRPGRCHHPSEVSRPAPAQPEQRLGGAEDKDWPEIGSPGRGNSSARAARQGRQEPRLLPPLP